LTGPISFVYGNCVFGSRLDDSWAAFVVEPASYAWMGDDGRRARFLSLVAALEALEADMQIVRISRRWSLERYSEETHGVAECFGCGGGDQYVRDHVRRLSSIGASTPAVFVLVSLREPQRDVASFLSLAATQHPRRWWESVRRALWLGDRAWLSARELEQLRVLADRVHARLSGLLPVRPARGVELQWVIRRSFCRSLGEPVVDGLDAPSALVFERNGQAVLAPLEGDVLRWMDGCVEQHGRHLRIESELGTSWQALLVVGALPQRTPFPGAAAELMFAPVESLSFPVDLSLNVRYLPNELAVRIARKRIQDADQIVRAEADGDQGVSDLGYERTQEARDLLAFLQGSSKPPLLRGSLTIAIASAVEEELERRVEACRLAYGETRLHRPLGDQLRLFVQHLPGQRARVAGYDEVMTTEQVAAMMPTAAHIVGSDRGFYLGHTLSGSRRPVRFNLSEGSEHDRNATVLSVGALGSGKTTLAQKLEYEGFLQGARVIDCDPKGDHRFHLLDEVAPHVESVPLTPDPALRGMLDPLRVAPAHLRHDATVSFLRALLPEHVDAAWETAVVRIVDEVLTRSTDPTCGEIVRALSVGDATEVEIGRVLGVYSRSGLTQLGFAQAGAKPPAVGKRRVTYLPIRDLPGAAPGTPRSEYTQAERVGEQLVRLIAMFAMHLMTVERQRLKLFSFDEGWRLLGDPVGRGLLAALQRMGRSELAVPIISTQLISDALIGERESLANLIGATFVFGMRSDDEAARALALLGLDPNDTRTRDTLLEFDSGRCLFRDHRGRIEAIQVDLVSPALRRAFSTTPRRG
jgi:AAA-like domain